jgi:transcriptional regulator with XRE-family HTH domain
MEHLRRKPETALQAWRRVAGTTNDAIAARLDVGVRTIADVMNGKGGKGTAALLAELSGIERATIEAGEVRTDWWLTLDTSGKCTALTTVERVEESKP